MRLAGKLVVGLIELGPLPITKTFQDVYPTRPSFTISSSGVRSFLQSHWGKESPGYQKACSTVTTINNAPLAFWISGVRDEPTHICQRAYPEGALHFVAAGAILPAYCSSRDFRFLTDSTKVGPAHDT